MHITFFGASGGVTGSNSLVESGPYKILIDCGMYQGNADVEASNEAPLPFDPKSVTQVFVTHAHLDHVGRLPLLAKNGYEGFFYATKPTVELAELIMRDALNVMEYDHQKFGRPILYTAQDIAEVMSRFKGVEYGEALVLDNPSTVSLHHEAVTTTPSSPPSQGGENVAPSLRRRGLGGGLTVTFHDAGHIFGSAFIELHVEGKRVVFSGDVGNISVPILRDTEDLPDRLDALVCESTYGDRLHESSEERQAIIERLVAEAIDRGGVLMIPSFSLERTQELIYELNDLIDRKHRLKRVPIFLDSPLAIDALKVYRKYTQYYDAEATRFFKDGDDLFDFPGLTMTHSREESMKINHTPGPKIIIAGAGMMTGGRILHHALRYLSDERNTLLLIGYQSPGTLGHQIYSGKSPVDVLGEKVQVKCCVKMVGALSAHGDQNKLLSWITAARPAQVFLNHGDQAAKEAFAIKLEALGVKVTVVGVGMGVEVEGE